MTTLDILIILFALVGAGLGLYKGLISQIGSIAAIIIAIIACRCFGSAATALMSHWLDPYGTGSAWGAYSASVLGNVALFALVYIVVLFVVKIIHSLSHVLLMGPIDHAAGALFGVFKWLLLLSALINLWFVFSPDSQCVKQSKIADGRLAEWVAGFAPSVIGAYGEYRDKDGNSDAPEAEFGDNESDNDSKSI